MQSWSKDILIDRLEQIRESISMIQTWCYVETGTLITYFSQFSVLKYPTYTVLRFYSSQKYLYVCTKRLHTDYTFFLYYQRNIRKHQVLRVNHELAGELMFTDVLI